jgi:hypothetical protein
VDEDTEPEMREDFVVDKRRSIKDWDRLSRAGLWFSQLFARTIMPFEVETWINSKVAEARQ